MLVLSACKICPFQSINNSMVHNVVKVKFCEFLCEAVVSVFGRDHRIIENQCLIGLVQCRWICEFVTKMAGEGTLAILYYFDF